MRLFFGKEDGGIVRSRCRLLVETFVVLNILDTYTFVYTMRGVDRLPLGTRLRTSR